LHCLVALAAVALGAAFWIFYLFFCCVSVISFLHLPAFAFDQWSGRVACVFPMFWPCFGFV